MLPGAEAAGVSGDIVEVKIGAVCGWLAGRGNVAGLLAVRDAGLEIQTKPVVSAMFRPRRVDGEDAHLDAVIAAFPELGPAVGFRKLTDIIFRPELPADTVAWVVDMIKNPLLPNATASKELVACIKDGNRRNGGFFLPERAALIKTLVGAAGDGSGDPFSQTPSASLRRFDARAEEVQALAEVCATFCQTNVVDVLG